jgi:hypothetical protein
MLDRALDALQRRTLERRGAAWGLALALGAASTVIVLTHYINDDAAWCYYVAGRVLDGARLYDEILDINPPLFFYFSLPPAAWARLWSGLDPRWLTLYVCGWVALCLALCRARLRALDVPEAARRFMLLALVVLLVPFYDFGQREHLMLLLVSPYVLAVAARACGRAPGTRTLLALGLLAGVGLAFKPFFLAVWAGLEAYLWFARRQGPPWRRPENAAIALVLGSYALALALLTPGYFAVAGMAWQVYGAFNASVLQLVLYPTTLLGVLALALWGSARGFRIAAGDRPAAPGDGDTALGDVLAVATAAWLISALVQQKGFSYHFYPASVGALWLLIVALPRVAARAPLLRRPLRAAAATAGLFVVLAFAAIAAGRLAGVDLLPHPDKALMDDLVRVIRAHSAPGDAVFFFSTAMPPAWPVIAYTGSDWPVRFQHLWPLPGLYADAQRDATPFPYHPPAQQSALERFMVEATLADLQRRPPAVIAVDTSPVMLGLGRTTFDFREYFGQEPAFARWWTQYAPVDTIGPYVIYVRQAR